MGSNYSQHRVMGVKGQGLRTGSSWVLKGLCPGEKHLGPEWPNGRPELGAVDTED